MEFLYSNYKRMLKEINDQKYKIMLYNEAHNEEKICILRHDIDFDIKKACEMAQIEYDMGIKSTYFVLVSTDFYNVFSKESSELLAKIMELGHEIGLHFDEQRYLIETIDDIKKFVEYEIQILSNALNKKVEVISMHRPSQMFLENEVDFEEVINSYSSYFFKEMKYVSDSRMNWREDVFKVINSNSHDKLHILTHPFWYSDNIEDCKQKLVTFIDNSKLERFKSLNSNFRDLNEYIRLEDIK